MSKAWYPPYQRGPGTHYCWHPYVRAFEWQGEVCVIHKDGRAWYRVSHRDSGYGCGVGADSQYAAELSSRMTFDKHPRKTKRLMREATARRGKPSYSLGLMLIIKADQHAATEAVST